MEAPAKACRDELNRLAVTLGALTAVANRCKQNPATQRWHWGSRRKDPKGFEAFHVYDDDMNVDEEADSDTKSWSDGSWGVLDSNEDPRTHQALL